MPSTFTYPTRDGDVKISTQIGDYEVSQKKKVIVIKDDDGRTYDYLNPDEWQFYAKIDHKKKTAEYKPYRGGLFVLWFGASGTTRVMLYADSLESALEEAAGFLADHAPGHITPLKEHHEEFEKELKHELGHAPTEEELQEAYDEGKDQVDLTYTESGYIQSWEWGIDVDPEGHHDQKLVDVAMAIGSLVEPVEFDE